jgi:hypothetical protein
VQLRGRARRSLIAGFAVAALGATGCIPFGDSDGYGPWLGSLVNPIVVFDAEVVDTRTVKLDMLGVDGKVVHVEPYAMATVDDVTVVASFAADDFQRDRKTRFDSLISNSTPLEIVDVHGVRLEPGRRYRIYLWHFGAVSDPTYEFAVGFAWDLSADRPAERQSANGWQDDFDALRSAGLVDDDMAGADVLLEITRAFRAPDPDARQRDIVVTLVGESMLPSTLAPVIDTTAP